MLVKGKHKKNPMVYFSRPLLPVRWTVKVIYNMENQVHFARLTDAPAGSENGKLVDCMCSRCGELA